MDRHQVRHGFLETGSRGRVQYYSPRGKDAPKYHRKNGPSEVDPSGLVLYEHRGRLHRESGPAVYYPYGKVEYHLENSPTYHALSESEFIKVRV